MKKLLAAIVLASASLPSRAQSINVDFEPADTPVGRPTPYYGASALAPGYWNSVGSGFVPNLRQWDGTVSGVSLTLGDDSAGCNLSAFEYHGIPSLADVDDSLLGDRWNPGASLQVPCTFEGLLPGNYVVDVIVPSPFCGSIIGTRVEVVGSPDPPVEATGSWSGSYVEGQSYTRHAVTVTDGTITIRFDMIPFTGYLEVSGIQLQYGEQEILGTTLCFGDGSESTCPCVNTGFLERGCENSAGTGGGVLFATGTANPDTVVLRAYDLRPTSLAIFFQGDVTTFPTGYGDGLRCTGGTIRRLYAKNASTGEAFAPMPGDPSITLRSAQLGVPIADPDLRTYQVFYRDPTPGFCPHGSTFNVTNALEIDW